MSARNSITATQNIIPLGASLDVGVTGVSADPDFNHARDRFVAGSSGTEGRPGFPAGRLTSCRRFAHIETQLTRRHAYGLFVGLVTTGLFAVAGSGTQADPIKPASAQCDVGPGSVVTCSSDLSSGVRIDNPTDGTDYTTLVVNGLTADIIPSAATGAGISFIADSSVATDIVVNIDLGDYKIVNTGDFAAGTGILVDTDASTVRPSSVTVTGNGYVETNGRQARGVDVYNVNMKTHVTHYGDIITLGEQSQGIHAVSRGAGSGDNSVTAIHVGTITTLDNQQTEAIYAESSGGSGKTTVVQIGKVESNDNRDGAGVISAASSGTGGVSITQKGTIISNQNAAGISVDSSTYQGQPGGEVWVRQFGSIDVARDGIFVDNEFFDTTVKKEGSILAGRDGIHVSEYGNPDTDGNFTVLLNFDEETIDEVAGESIGGMSETTIDAGNVGVNFVGGADNQLITREIVTIDGDNFDVQGTTGDETITNYGTLTAPGNIDLGDGSNAFENMAGAVFNSGTLVNLGGGNLMVQINSTGSDTLFISGSADLEGGTVVATFENGQDTSLFKRHLILRTQGGLDGTSFVDLDSNLDDYELVYHQGRSAFVMKGNTQVTFCDFANTQNQRSTACTGLDSLPLDDELVVIFEAFNEGNDDLVRAAYDALSGELHASMKGALAVSLQQQGATVFSRMRDLLITSSFKNSTAVTAGLAIGSGGEGGGESAAIPFGFWASGYGGWSDVDATGNTAQMEDEYSGFLIGMDGELLDTLKLGFVGGSSKNAVAQDDRNSDGDIETFTAGLYGGTEFGNARLRFAGLFSQHSLETSHRVEILDLNEMVLAEYDATSWQVSAETGYHLEAGSIEW